MIDAHLHVWTVDAERYPWQPTLPGVSIPSHSATVEEFVVQMDAAGVDHAVLVQPSTYGWDNSYLSNALARYPGRFAGVCLVDVRAEGAAEELYYWCEERGFHGVRVNLIATQDASWILDKEREVIWNTAEELEIPVLFQAFPHQAEILGILAPRYTNLNLIVDNFGPQMFEDENGLDAINSLARHSNIWFKLICAAPDSHEQYPFQDLWPLFEHAVRQFGHERILFGTDYPYVLQACSYQEAIAWPDRLPFLDERARLAIVDGNARSLWSFQTDAN